MQNHPTWYLPWGSPTTSVQKIIPFQLNNGLTTAAAAAAVQCQLTSPVQPNYQNYANQIHSMHHVNALPYHHQQHQQHHLEQLNSYINKEQQNTVQHLNLAQQANIQTHNLAHHTLPALTQQQATNSAQQQQQQNTIQTSCLPTTNSNYVQHQVQQSLHPDHIIIQQNFPHQNNSINHHHHQQNLNSPNSIYSLETLAQQASTYHHHSSPQQTLNAAAMFTPLSLQTFIQATNSNPTSNHLGFVGGEQKTLTATNYGLAAIPAATTLGIQSSLQATIAQPSIALNNQPKYTIAGINLITNGLNNSNNLNIKKIGQTDKQKLKLLNPEKRKADDEDVSKDLKKAKLETKALKAKRPGFTDERYQETSYYIENGLRKVYPYYFTFTTFTKGRWVGEKILDVFAREFRAHPAEEYERCIKAGTLTVNYDKVPIDYNLKHNDLLANIVHRHEVPVTSQQIKIIHMDDDIVVVNKPASIPVHPCGRYRHNTVVFIMAKEYNLKNLRTIHRLDRLTSGLLLFGRNPKKARLMEQQIRTRVVRKEYVCRVVGDFPDEIIECNEPIEVVSYKIGVCKVSQKGKECSTVFEKLCFNGKTSVVSCKPRTGRMHQIRVHLQYLGYPIINDPLYNHEVFGPKRGCGGDMGGKSDDELIKDLITIHNAENWLGIDGDSEMPLFKPMKVDSLDEESRESSPCVESSRTASLASSSPTESPVSVNLNHDTQLNQSGRIEEGAEIKASVSTQTGHETPDLAFNPEKLTADKHCYECKVRYRDPKPRDLIMYLHAWKYKGPEWGYQTELPAWADPHYDESTSN